MIIQRGYTVEHDPDPALASLSLSLSFSFFTVLRAFEHGPLIETMPEYAAIFALRVSPPLFPPLLFSSTFFSSRRSATFRNCSAIARARALSRALKPAQNVRLVRASNVTEHKHRTIETKSETGLFRSPPLVLSTLVVFERAARTFD